MWYSRLIRVLLSAIVVVANVGWCCSYDTGTNDAGQDLGAHAHHSAPTPRGLIAKTLPPTHHGSDPSHAPDQDDSGCLDNLTMVSTDFTAGTVLTDSGSYYQTALALVLSPNQAAWLVLCDPAPRGFETSPDVFRGDSLRALSRLITV